MIKRGYLFIIFEVSLEDSLALGLRAYKRENLINNIGFSVLFRVISLVFWFSVIVQGQLFIEKMFRFFSYVFFRVKSLKIFKLKWRKLVLTKVTTAYSTCLKRLLTAHSFIFISNLICLLRKLRTFLHAFSNIFLTSLPLFLILNIRVSGGHWKSH